MNLRIFMLCEECRKVTELFFGETTREIAVDMKTIDVRKRFLSRNLIT